MSDELEQLESTSSEIDSTEQALDEGVTAAAAELSGDEVTLEDLRALPGTEDMSDEELLALYNETSKEKETPQTPAAVARAFKVFGADDKEITDIDKMTVADFLKSKIGYNANKAEQRKTFEELLRVAQYGHLNESKLSRAEAARQAALKELSGLKEANQRYTQNEKLWNYALNQFLLGNDKPMDAIIQKFREQAGAPPELAGETGTTDSAAEAEGMRVWYEEIQPRADELAQRYGAKNAEVRNYVQYLINNEPDLTQERLDEILDSEMPMILEQNGFRASGAAAAPAVQQQSNSEVEELKKQLAELQAQVKNSKTAEVKQRLKRLPPSSSGRQSGDVEGGEVPSGAMKSREDFKKFLRS